MKYKLGKNVEVGNKILLSDGWHKITTKFDDLIVTNKGTEVRYGDTIYGLKSN